MLLTGKNIIDNQYSSEGDAFFHGFDPCARTPVEPPYYEATNAEIDKAVSAAAEAFGHFAATSHAQRAELLECIADEIQKSGAFLIERAMLETGLSEARLLGEKTRTVNQLRLFASLLSDVQWVEARIDFRDLETENSVQNDIRQMQVALGPVAVFSAGNFPLAFSVAGADVASAFSAGCPVIVKAHPGHPGTSEFMGKAILNAIHKCNLPSGIFSVVHGASYNVGQLLVKHPLLKAVAFTGSHTGGKALFDIAMQRFEPIPFFAEMGSVNPVFFLPAAVSFRAEKIAEAYVNSFNLGVGQFCTNPGISFVFDTPELQAFKKYLVTYTSSIQAESMLSSAIEVRLKKQLEQIETGGFCKLLAKGKPNNNKTTPLLFEVDAKTFIEKHEVFAAEFFGPVSFLVVVSDESELLNCISLLKGQLTASFFIDDLDAIQAEKIINLMKNKVGRLIVNGFPTGVEVCHAMHHGGPFPATFNAAYTSVGSASIKRFLRPLCFQNFPQELLPEELRNDNAHHIWRLINGAFTQKSIRDE